MGKGPLPSIMAQLFNRKKVKRSSTNSGQAKKVAQKVKQTKRSNTGRKVRTNVHFFRPNTKTTARKPKAPTTSVVRLNKLHKNRIIKAPVTTEGAMKKIEEINTLVFKCDVRASKTQIKEAVQSLFEVSVAKCNTLIRPDGTKRAYCKLSA